MNNVFKLISILCILSIYSNDSFGQVEYEKFVLANSAKVEEEAIWNIIHQFLYPLTVSKDEVLWMDGDVVTSQFGKYSGVKIKLNVLNNSLYTRIDGQCYKLKNGAIKSFRINEDGLERSFEKHFYHRNLYEVNATSNFTSSELMSKIASFDEIELLEVYELQLLKKGNKVDFRLRFYSYNEVFSSSFNIYMMSDPKVTSYDLKIDEVATSENTFLEILVANENLKLVKWNYKKVGDKSISIVDQSQKSFFKENHYFVADTSHSMRQVFFTKGSVESVVKHITGIEVNAPFIINEKKLIKFLQNIQYESLQSKVRGK